jgi:hypothetical protein
MIYRSRLIGFRLEPREVDKYESLKKRVNVYSWSDLVRKALKELLDRHPEPTSDNGVKHPIGGLTPMPLFSKKRGGAKGPKKKARKKAG